MAEEKEAPLSPAQRSKIRRLSQPHDHDPSEAGGELNIVPFLDIVTNVLMFVLATIPAVFTSTITTEPPSTGGGGVREVKPTLNLAVLIVGEGVSMKTSGTSIGPGCEPGGGITVPKSGGEYDWASLKACAKKLKDANADFKDENTVTIAAEPGTEYQVVIGAMDALRQDADGNDLFSEVRFGAPRLAQMSQPTASTPRPGKPSAGAPVVKFKAALRKSIRRNAKEPEIDFLNITAMMDMMTIILVFLLKNMTSSNAAPPQSDDLKLPKSVITGQPKEEGTAVFISKTQILVGDQTDPVVMLPGREVMAQNGIEARYKRNGINDLYITPLANAMQAARELDKAIKGAKGEDTSKSTAIIIADSTTPYRVLLEVIFTLGQSEFGKFHLMVLTGAGGK